MPILHLGHPDTQAVIAAKKNSGSLFSFKTFVDWHDPLSCGDHIREGDMIIFVSAHQGYLSHMSILDNLPTRLEERFPHHSRIVIYPKQRTMRGLLESDDSLFVPSNF